MSDLVLGPVVGKIGGGAEVSEIPVDFTSPSGNGVKHVVDVPVPEGVTARVIVVGTSEVTTSSAHSWPSLIIGGQDIGLYHESVGGSATVTGPTVVEVSRESSSSSYDPSFVGTVYWWEVSGDPGGGGDTGGGGDEVPSDPGESGDNGGGGDEVPSDPGEGGDNGGGGDEAVITGTSSGEARDSFRAALTARGLDYKTVVTVPFLLDTSNVTTMRAMFDSCSSLTSVPDMDTSNVTNMAGMFYGCAALTSVPDMDTSNVTDMPFMFYNCTALTDGNVRCIGKKDGVETSFMIDSSGLTRLPFYDTNGNWTG